MHSALLGECSEVSDEPRRCVATGGSHAPDAPTAAELICRARVTPHASVSRRKALLAAVVASQPACRSSAGEPGIERRAPTGASQDPSASSASPGAPANDWAGLDVATVHRMREDERGGMAVVLLHGWGARGDDLVSLAQALARPKTRFFLPARPLPA